MNKRDKKELKEAAADFIHVVTEHVDTLVFLGDSTTLKELTGYYSRFTSSELIKRFREAGLQKDLDKLAEKTGRVKRGEVIV